MLNKNLRSVYVTYGAIEHGAGGQKKKTEYICRAHNLMAHNFSCLRLSLAWAIGRMGGIVLDEISYLSTASNCLASTSDGIVRALLLFTRVLNCLFALIAPDEGYGRRKRSAQKPIAIYIGLHRCIWCC